MYMCQTERDRDSDKDRPAGPPEVFCVVRPPENVQDLFAVSIPQFPSPSRHDQ